jgi:DNA polymerase zeta
VEFYKDVEFLSLVKRDYRGSQSQQSPIIRLYGTTEQGEKCCVHVHGYYPYLYIKAEEYTKAFLDPTTLRQFLELVEALFREAYKPAKK